MAHVVLSIGANLGDRLAALQSVLDAMATDFTAVRVSPVYETEPWGPVEQPQFLNACVTAETTLAPEQVLEFALGCEDRAGRVRDIRWGPRVLDVDVIAYDDVQQHTETLTLPHPRAHERAFVLVGWQAIEPAAVIPGHGSVAQCLAALSTADVHLRADLQLVAP